MRTKQAARHILFAALCLATSAATLYGCAKPPTTGVLAPSKPLSSGEQAFLKQLQSTPDKDRAQFMARHRSEVMAMAMGNRAFGEQMNAILGVKSQPGSK